MADPIECADLETIAEAGDTLAVVLTNGWYERSAALFAQRTGAPIYVPAGHAHLYEDLNEFATFSGGDTLPGNLLAIATPGHRADGGDQVLLSPLQGSTLIVGDCLGTAAKWTPWPELPLGGHPRNHPVPAETLTQLLEYEFEDLLPGHGAPIIGGARDALQKLIESGVSTSPPAAYDS